MLARSARASSLAGYLARIAGQGPSCSAAPAVGSAPAFAQGPLGRRPPAAGQMEEDDGEVKAIKLGFSDFLVFFFAAVLLWRVVRNQWSQVSLPWKKE